MKKRITMFTVVCSLQIAFIHAQSSVIWTQTNNPSAGNDFAKAVTADASGIYLAGHGNDSQGADAFWQMEKRDLSTGAVIWSQISNPHVGPYQASSSDLDWANAITADASGVYVAGSAYVPQYENMKGRIEKRDLGTGALIWAQTVSGAAEITGITADASGIYIAGHCNVAGDVQWYMEKRSLSTGAVIWTKLSNPGKGKGISDVANAITIDASGIYVAGTDEKTTGIQNQWRIEKHNLSTGAVIWAKTSNPSTGFDYVNGVAVDASGIYMAGTSNGQGRIEKRNLSTGALTWTQSGGGAASAITADASGLYVAGNPWGVEQRNPSTGALTCSSSNIGFSFAITTNASGIYVAGGNIVSGSDTQWRIEKYSKCGGSAFELSGLGSGTEVALDIISIYPNPSTEYIDYVITSASEGVATVKVFDMTGREVMSNTETLDGIVTTKRLSTAALASGSYLLQVTNQQERMQKQFMVR